MAGFYRLAKKMLPYYPGASCLQLAPNGIITHIVPLKGNEKAIGYNLLLDSQRDKEAFIARDSGKLTLAGPFSLVQGGIAAVGRLPIYIDDPSGTPTFWGFSTVLIRFPEVLVPAQLPLLVEQGFIYELFREHSDTGEKQIIAQSGDSPLKNPVKRSISVPNTTWTLCIAPSKGWGEPIWFLLRCVVGLLLSLSAAFVARQTLRLKKNQDDLESRVFQRTADLEAEKKHIVEILRNTRSGTWERNVQTGEIRFDEGWAEIAGYSLKELLPFTVKTWNNLTHSDDLKISQESLENKSTQASDYYECETRLRHKNGQWVWVLDRGKVIDWTKEGKPLRMSGTRQDITERKETEEALRASEERLQRIADTTPGAVYQYQLTPQGDDSFLYVSQGIQELFGYTAPQLLNDINLGWAVVAPEDVAVLRESILRSAKTMEPWAQEFRVIKEEGQAKWILGRATPFHHQDDGSVLWSGIFVDITARKRAEEDLKQQTARFQAIFHGIPDSVVLINRDREIVMCNPGTLRTYGYKLEELLGQSSSMFYANNGDHEEVGRVYFDPDMEDIKPYQMQYKRKNGEVFTGETVANIIRDSDGKTLGYLGMMRDITNRVQVEQEKYQLEIELRQAHKMEAVGILAGGIAHDFNNVLTAIFGHIEIAKKDLPEDHAVFETLETIERISRQGVAVTRALLTFSHKAPSEKHAVELSQLVKETVRILRRLLPASITIAEDYPDDSEFWVQADPGQIQQVLMNLTINARDAMENGGVLRISLGLEQDKTSGQLDADQDTTHGNVVFVVEDTGSGMDEETRAHLFEPFFTTKTRGAGTGLGLAIVHGIVTDHQGQIKVESQQGQGTRFVISLPLSLCHRSDDGDTAPPRAHNAADTGREQSILVVEDNEFVRDVMVTALKSAGYSVTSATDGQKAMSLFDAHRDEISLAVLDLDIPKETGMSCLDKIRKQRPEFPVVIVTGNIDLFLKIQPQSNAPILNKPFQMIELVELVHKTLDEQKGKE